MLPLLLRSLSSFYFQLLRSLPSSFLCIMLLLVPPFSEAQAAFIKKTRDSIDSDASFFDKHDWANIAPPRNSSPKNPVQADDFYVKNVAAWVPEKLFANHVPKCPNCCNNFNVNVAGARWVNNPKILFGISSHRYLDTKLYPCHGCGNFFAGHNEESMKLDGQKYMGYFNFSLSGSLAIDEELSCFLTINYEEPNEKIHSQLVQMSTEKYRTDRTRYNQAFRSGRLRNEEQQQVEVSDKSLATLKRTLMDKTDEMRIAERAAKDPLDFTALIRRKHGRNNRKAPLSGIGEGKLSELISTGILTGQQLLECEATPRCFYRKSFRNWKATAQQHFEALRENAASLKREVSVLEQSCTQMEVLEREDDQQQQAKRRKKCPHFSEMDDATGYNARTLSLGDIDQVQADSHWARKAFDPPFF
jgi:hypothetical protein